MIAVLRHPARTTVIALAALALVGAAGCGDDSDDSDDASTTSAATSTTASGSSSGAIRRLQSELDTLGCGAGATDGELGPETEAAIRHFQAAADLTVDGIVGVNTRSALEEAARTGSPNCTSTPQPPTTTTTSGAGSPQCNQQAIAAGVSAASSSDTVDEFQCSGDWAEAQVTTPGPNGFEYTALLNWKGNSWISVDRATYCENGSVPQAIFQAACETN